jgi:hypothetical protein
MYKASRVTSRGTTHNFWAAYPNNNVYRDNAIHLYKKEPGSNITVTSKDRIRTLDPNAMPSVGLPLYV